MRTSNSIIAASGLLSGVANAFPDAVQILNAALGVRNKTPPPDTITIPGYTTTYSGHMIEVTLSSGVTPVPTTYSMPPSTVTVPPEVTTVPVIMEAIVCPEPTGLTREAGVKFSGNYGCPVGQICNPVKPSGCNVWPGPPRNDFACDQNDCIPVPLSNPKTNQRIAGRQGSSWGRFHLDPRSFGVGFEVFEYGSSPGLQQRGLNWPQKRQNGSDERITPGDCRGICDEAYLVWQDNEDSPTLCDASVSESFLSTLRRCTGCLRQTEEYKNADRQTIKEFFTGQQVDITEKCDEDPFPIGSGPAPANPPGNTITTPQAPGSPTNTPVIPPSNPPPNPTPPPSPPLSSSTPSPTPEPSPSTEIETTPAPPNSISTGPDESTPSEASSSSGTLPDSSSSSAEPPSSGSPGSPSTGSPESSSTDSPESPPTSSTDVPSASSAETPGSPESQGTDSPSASDSSAPAPGTSSAPSETPIPVPSAPNVTTDETGTRTTLGVVPNPVPTTQGTVVVPTPGGTPAPLPPPSAAFRTTVGGTILATLLTFLAVLA